MTVLVTPAQKDLARLGLELADRLGEPRDPRMEKIAHALQYDPQAEAERDDFKVELELAKRADLLDKVRERYEQGNSHQAALRQVLMENSAKVGESILGDLWLARVTLALTKRREAERHGVDRPEPERTAAVRQPAPGPFSM